MKWPENNTDKRNDRIYNTLRPFKQVIRDKTFCDFISRIFLIDPELRASAKDLLNDDFLKDYETDEEDDYSEEENSKLRGKFNS